MGAPRFVMDDFWPSDLFLGGIPGAWYDPTDLSTMFQDSAGTTPVTAVEQPVGLILDKSQWLAQGSQLVVNGDGTTLTGWTPVNDAGCTTTVSGGQFVLTTVAAGGARLRQTIPVTAGKTYAISIFINANNDSGANSFQIWGTGYGAGTLVFAPQVFNGVFTAIVQATSANLYLQLNAYRAASGTVAYYDDVSVRELAGNHASQSTAASRPTYRARYNLLTFSEEFQNATWIKTRSTIAQDAAVAPDGTTTADALTQQTGQTSFGHASQYLMLAAQSYTFSVFAKANTKNWIILRDDFNGARSTWFNVSNGTVGTTNAGHVATITAATNGYYRCQITFTATAINNQVLIGLADTNGSTTVTDSGNVYIWGAQLLTAADVTATGNAYQRIAAATVYDTAPIFRPYLAFDGLDDLLATAAINFTSTDKMTVFAGVTKLSTATFDIATLSADWTSNNGTFGIGALSPNAYFFGLRGTNFEYYTGTTFTAPVTNVLTASYDIAGAAIANEIVPRVNATTPTLAPNGGPAGTGNFGTHVLNISRALVMFNGRLYSLIVRGAASSVTEIADTELWVNARTGAF